MNFSVSFRTLLQGNDPCSIVARGESEKDTLQTQVSIQTRMLWQKHLFKPGIQTNTREDITGIPKVFHALLEVTPASTRADQGQKEAFPDQNDLELRQDMGWPSTGALRI
jgi:hypothetical protein